MSPVAIALIVYLVGGLLFLACMWRYNPVMKRRIKDAPSQLFDKLILKGEFTGLRTVTAMMYLGLWLGWVFILVGMVQGKYEGSNRKHRINKGD